MDSAAGEIARDTSAEFHELRCVAPATVTESRIARRAASGHDPSDATAKVAQQMATVTEPWDTAVAIDTTGTVAEAVVAAVRALQPDASVARNRLASEG